MNMNKNLIALGCALMLGQGVAAVANATPATASEKDKMISIVGAEQISQKDYDTIRNRWRNFLTRLPDSGVSKAEMAGVVAYNEQGATTAYEKMIFDADRPAIFKVGENMKNGVDVMAQYRALRAVAIGYATRGTKFYQDPKIKAQINEALEWLYVNAYHEELPELGNWWQWELGIPKLLNEIITLVYEDIPAKNRVKYLKASQYFQPYAKWSGVSPSATYSTSPEKRISTGGNRLDTSIISFMRGVLMQDAEQVFDGLTAAVEVGEWVKDGDGFYRDGSFVQHGNVAYNGTYASVLFDGLGQMLYLINGTGLTMNDPRLDNVYQSIVNGYSYLFINGGITDAVNGRAISRDKSSDITRANSLITTLTLLSEGKSEKYQGAVKALIKKVVKDNNLSNFVKEEENLVVKGLLEKIMQDAAIQTPNVLGTKVFGAMDRAVGLNDKGGKVVLSMHSNRIANFETMNGENQKGWYTGEGMSYIYGKDSAQFTEFWPTADMYHLPGVTNSQTPIKEKAGERRPRPFVTPTAFAGGVSNGEMAFVGMDLLSWNRLTQAKKSWLMVDGVTLALGSNIQSQDGDVHTTIDNRILKAAKVLVNGLEVKDNQLIADPAKVAINFKGNMKGENIGYRVIKGPALHLDFTQNQGTWKAIGGKDDKAINKDYFVAYFDHGYKPWNGEYAYVVMPMFTPSEVNAFDTSRFEIVQMDDKAHIVKDLKTNTTAMHFFDEGKGKFDDVKVLSAMSILKQDKGDTVELYVADPAQLQNYRSVIELKDRYELIESSDKDLQLSHTSYSTKLKVDLRNNGATHKIVLRKVK